MAARAGSVAVRGLGLTLNLNPVLLLLLLCRSLEWLRALGLSQYEGAMRSHGMVRLELAAALTEEDCVKLKVRLVSSR